VDVLALVAGVRAATPARAALDDELLRVTREHLRRIGSAGVRVDARLLVGGVEEAHGALVPAAEIAAELRLKPRAVQARAARRGIRKRGGRWLFTAAEVEVLRASLAGGAR
jgi:hypothetical protein